jgi:hypothetical protein
MRTTSMIVTALWFDRISGATTACTRLPAARSINHTLPAKMPVVGVSLADPAAGEAGALGRFSKPVSY